MKSKAWLLFALTSLTAASVLAQVSNSLPPAASPPMAPAPGAPDAPSGLTVEPAAKPVKEHKAKGHHAKKAAAVKKAPAVKSDVILNPPVAATVKCEVLDVRGQGSFAGEVIGHVKKGETVTVLEEITRGHVHAGEPEEWSRIVMPTNGTVWVDANFVNSDTNAVRVKKVNLRGGPGENYSIVGRLEKDDAIKVIRKKGDWLEIEAPTNAYAFVASEFLDKQGATATPALAEAAPTPPPAPAPQPVVVNVPPETAQAPVPAAAPAEATPAPAAPAPTAPAPTSASETEQELAALHQAMATPTTPAPAPAPTTTEEAPRVVTRDGFVHRAFNFQAPAGFELHDIKTGVLTEYLQPAPGDKKFKIFVGTRVRITGTESLDPNWPRTPVLQIQSVDLMP